MPPVYKASTHPVPFDKKGGSASSSKRRGAPLARVPRSVWKDFERPVTSTKKSKEDEISRRFSSVLTPFARNVVTKSSKSPKRPSRRKSRTKGGPAKVKIPLRSNVSPLTPSIPPLDGWSPSDGHWDPLLLVVITYKEYYRESTKAIRNRSTKNKE